MVPLATTRVTKKVGTALYAVGIFFLMFCFQKTYSTAVFFIDYRYTYANMVLVFLLGVVFTALYYRCYRDMVAVGRVVHAMSVAVVAEYAVYRLFFRDWVLHHFEYITDDYHLIYAVLCLFSVLCTLSVVRIVSDDPHLGYNGFYSHLVRGALWLFALCFAFIFFINRGGENPVYQDVNLVPFHGELKVLFHLAANPYDTLHLLVNVVFFGLFSVLVAGWARRRQYLWGMIVPVATSVGMEIYQYLSYHGDPDIDDVITNTLGAVLGVVVYRLIQTKLLSKEKDI